MQNETPKRAQFLLLIVFLICLEAVGCRKTEAPETPILSDRYCFDKGYLCSFSSYVPNPDDETDPISRTEYRFDNNFFTIAVTPVEKGSEADLLYHCNTEELILEAYDLKGKDWLDFPFTDREWDALIWPDAIDSVDSEFIQLSDQSRSDVKAMLLGKDCYLISSRQSLYYLKLSNHPSSEGRKYIWSINKLRKLEKESGAKYPIACGYIQRSEKYDLIYLVEKQDHPFFAESPIGLLVIDGSEERLPDKYSSGDYVCIQVNGVLDSDPCQWCYLTCDIISNEHAGISYEEVKQQLTETEKILSEALQ